jgi:hypothetical protein
MSWLWPIRTGKTLFDVWTVCHIAFWVVVGFDLQAIGLAFWPSLGITYVGATVWELFERQAEKRWPRIWKNPEAAINSWVGDVLIAATGGTSAGYALAGLG